MLFGYRLTLRTAKNQPINLVSMRQGVECERSVSEVCYSLLFCLANEFIYNFWESEGKMVLCGVPLVTFLSL